MRRNLNSLLRQYIITEILRHPGDAIKIESERELCERFKTSRETVRKAIASLVDERALIVVHGSGTYSNPSWTYQGVTALQCPMVGIVNQYGSSNCLGAYNWDIMTGIRHHFATDAGITMNLIQLSSSSPGKSAAEIANLKLDAVFWIHPLPARMRVIEMLDEMGIPVVSIARSPKNSLHSVAYDYMLAARNLARYFADSGCCQPIFATDGGDKCYYDMGEEFYRELKRLGVEPDRRCFIFDVSRIGESIEALRRAGIRPDGAFAFGNVFWPFRGNYRKTFGEAAFEALNLVLVKAIVGENLRFPYLNIDPFELGKAAANILKQRQQGAGGPGNILLEAKVVTLRK